jgi:hypothetical protein
MVIIGFEHALGLTRAYADSGTNYVIMRGDHMVSGCLGYADSGTYYTQ